MIWKKWVLEITISFSQAMNKIDNEPGDCISGVCKYLVRNFTDEFFWIIDELIASIENRTLSTPVKHNATWKRYFG